MKNDPTHQNRISGPVRVSRSEFNYLHVNKRNQEHKKLQEKRKRQRNARKVNRNAR